MESISRPPIAPERIAHPIGKDVVGGVRAVRGVVEGVVGGGASIEVQAKNLSTECIRVLRRGRVPADRGVPLYPALRAASVPLQLPAR